MSTQPQYQTRDRDRVSLFEKIALGSGQLTMFFGFAAVGSFAIPVYQMTLGLDPRLFAIALAIPRFWDAVTDPMMGLISDNTHSRWGRRKPYVVLGSILQAFAFGLIWMAPEGWGQTATFAYLVVTLILFYTCFTVFSVPLNSLVYEMTPDPQERTRVTAFGGYFSKIGEYLYQWVFPLTGLAIFASKMQGVRVVGWCVAILIFAGVGMLPGIFVKERYFKKAAKQEKVRFLPGVKATFGSRAFRILVGLTILQILAGMLASNLDYYLLVFSMNDGVVAHGAVWKAILSGGYATVGIISIPIITWVSGRIGKRTTLALAFGLVLIGAIGKWILYTPGSGWALFDRLDAFLDGLPFLKATPGNCWKILIDPIFCGPVWVAIGVLNPSMFADVCDEDELRHGLRREGLFGSIFSWIQKTGYSLAFVGAFSALPLIGFDAKLGGNQTPETILSLRLILTISTAVWSVAAIALLCFYPLTQKRSYEIRDELEARRGTLD